eukprot:scaffold32215_cov31-Phaeocystis_antarctica.AAC.2
MMKTMRARCTDPAPSISVAGWVAWGGSRGSPVVKVNIPAAGATTTLEPTFAFKRAVYDAYQAFERRSSVLCARSRSVNPGVLDVSIPSQFWIPWAKGC